MEQENLFGKLFNSIPLVSEDHLEILIQTLDKETATFMLIQAIKFAYHSGVYSLGESEVLSKCIRVISKKNQIESAD